MIGFSATIITLLVTLTRDIENVRGFQFTLGFYILAIVFSFIAIEFFTLAAWDIEKNYNRWSTIGSSFYGPAKSSMIVGISLTFVVIMDLFVLACFTISLFFIGYIFYYALRHLIKKEGEFKRLRWFVRSIIFSELFIGLLLVLWIKNYI